jgi:hypothetical protein
VSFSAAAQHVKRHSSETVKFGGMDGAHGYAGLWARPFMPTPGRRQRPYHLCQCLGGWPIGAMSKWLKPVLFGIWGLLLIPLIATILEKRLTHIPKKFGNSSLSRFCGNYPNSKKGKRPAN